MHEIRNLTNAPYDLETVNGIVRLPALGTAKGEFSPDYLAAMRALGMYEVTELASDGEDNGPDEEDIEALRAEAEELGVDVDGRWGAKRLESEIAKAKKA